MVFLHCRFPRVVPALRRRHLSREQGLVVEDRGGQAEVAHGCMDCRSIPAAGVVEGPYHSDACMCAGGSGTLGEKAGAFFGSFTCGHWRAVDVGRRHLGQDLSCRNGVGAQFWTEARRVVLGCRDPPRCSFDCLKDCFSGRGRPPKEQPWPVVRRCVGAID
jgi:hypothetical protein